MRRVIHFLFLFSLLGCASQQDLNTLKWEVDTLNTRLTKAEEQLREKDRIFGQTLTQQAELQVRYTEIQDQLLSLQGRLEEFQASGSTGEGGAAATRIDALEQDIQAIREYLDKKPVPSKSLYESGVEKFRAGRYADAIVELESFLAHNPDAALIDNAHFWIGECYYALGKYEDAILRYDLVVRKYKTSEKVADCLLKQGMSFMRMGDKETGTLILQQLVKGYPDSGAAAKAKNIMKDGTEDG
jgi:tol-pal system protein YbgF